jgi:hypothetical protein
MDLKSLVCVGDAIVQHRLVGAHLLSLSLKIHKVAVDVVRKPSGLNQPS